MSSLEKIGVLLLPPHSKIDVGNYVICQRDKFIKGEHKYRESIDFTEMCLYFFSDDKIGDYDWYYDTKQKALRFGCNNSLPGGYKKKIIATTDKNLVNGFNQCDGCRTNLPIENGIHRDNQHFGIGCTKDKYLSNIPSISISCIEYYIFEYCKGNIITEAFVNYKNNLPVLDDNNEISFITPKQEKKNLYNKEELKIIINQYREENLLDRNKPYHYEAEISGGLDDLLIWIDEKF